MAAADIGPKNRLNAFVIGEIARMIYGPSPTEDEFNAVAAEMGDCLHCDIARLVDDMKDEADRLSRRAF